MTDNQKTIKLEFPYEEINFNDEKYTVFKNLHGDNMIIKNHDGLILDKYWFLEMIAMCDNKKSLFDLNRAIDYLQNEWSDSFEMMRQYVFCAKLKELMHNEFYYQDLFKKKAEELGCGKIVDHRDNPKHKPDAWIDRNGELIPVECKLHDFDTKALKQLARYMTFYHTEHGIAVARSLTIELPDNIEFIPFSDFTED